MWLSFIRWPRVTWWTKWALSGNRTASWRRGVSTATSNGTRSSQNTCTAMSMLRLSTLGREPTTHSWRIHSEPPCSPGLTSVLLAVYPSNDWLIDCRTNACSNADRSPMLRLRESTSSFLPGQVAVNFVMLKIISSNFGEAIKRSKS